LYDWTPDPEDSSWQDELARIIEDESVVHLDDLILRRTSLGDNPRRALRIAPQVCDLFGWTEERCQDEIERVRDHCPRIASSLSSIDEPV